jgi:threonine dehydratase
MQLPTFADIQQAATRIKPYAHRTGVHLHEPESAGRRRGLLQMQNFQKVGRLSFAAPVTPSCPLRGGGTARRGDALFRNHAAALALAARLRHSAWIVMPKPPRW